MLIFFFFFYLSFKTFDQLYHCFCWQCQLDTEKCNIQMMCNCFFLLQWCLFFQHLQKSQWHKSVGIKFLLKPFQKEMYLHQFLVFSFFFNFMGFNPAYANIHTHYEHYSYFMDRPRRKDMCLPFFCKWFQFHSWIYRIVCFFSIIKWLNLKRIYT